MVLYRRINIFFSLENIILYLGNKGPDLQVCSPFSCSAFAAECCHLVAKSSSVEKGRDELSAWAHT